MEDPHSLEPRPFILVLVAGWRNDGVADELTSEGTGAVEGGVDGLGLAEQQRVLDASDADAGDVASHGDFERQAVIEAGLDAREESRGCTDGDDPQLGCFLRCDRLCHAGADC